MFKIYYFLHLTLITIIFTSIGFSNNFNSSQDTDNNSNEENSLCLSLKKPQDNHEANGWWIVAGIAMASKGSPVKGKPNLGAPLQANKSTLPSNFENTFQGGLPGNIDIISNTNIRWNNACDNWTKNQNYFYPNHKTTSQNLQTLTTFVSKHPIIEAKEKYRQILCTNWTKDKNFFTTDHESFYRTQIEELSKIEKAAKKNGLVLYHGIHTRTANFYDFTNEVRFLLKENNQPIKGEQFVKIFLRNNRVYAQF